MPTPDALCIHAHFYQPPRAHPFTGEIPRELGAEPYHDYNEKITAECYRPNAELGNFDRISFNFGPTLASWLEVHATDVYGAILDADRQHGNAVAQVYNHTILPLATEGDKATQIAWGISDFVHRYGRTPQGMWLAETAVDLPTLSALAHAGIQYTVLAPWQAAGTDPHHTNTIDTTQPYWVDLPDGERITVFFYDPNLSGTIHKPGFAQADRVARDGLPMRIDNRWFGSRGGQLILGASDGEYYGHHLPGREHFLANLTAREAQAAGFRVTTLNEWIAQHPPTATIHIRENTAWSCPHDLHRWTRDCDCAREPATPNATGHWKTGLRHALNQLAERVDALYVAATLGWLRDPWEARMALLPTYQGWQSWDAFFMEHGTSALHDLPADERVTQLSRLRALLEGQFYRQMMFTSCGFFFEDLERIEPVNDIRYAAKAIHLTEIGAPGLSSPRDAFAADLMTSRSERTNVTAADIFWREIAAN